MHSKVYTETPATRSPILTVVLSVLILALLTAAALAALHWFQKRAQSTPEMTSPSYALRVTGVSLYNAHTQDSGLQEADYEAVLQ
jgi:hypothetical protein